MNLKHFSPGTDHAIDWNKVDQTAIQMLDNARDMAGVNFIVTSNYRTPEESLKVANGSAKHPESDAHTEIPCTAFDIACSDSVSRLKIVSACLKAGFTRIGFNSRHVHVDNSKRLPQNVMWIE